MMDIMEWFALGVGVIVGLLGYFRVVDYIFIVIYYALFSTRRNFGDMYIAADDEATYSYFKSQLEGVGLYADYLRLHKKVQPSSFTRFRAYYDTLVVMIFGRISPLVMLPAIIFWGNWYYYVIGVLVAVVLLLIYKRFVKNARAGYFQRLMVISVLRDYTREHKLK